MKITQDLGTHCPGCSQEYDIIIFHLSKLLWDNHSIENFLHLKKKITSIQRLAKQELKIKVAQNLLEGTLYLSASHHKFFFLGSKPLWA